MLQEVAPNSKEADIIIAGMCIWGMTYEDSKYNENHYPMKAAEIRKICFGDLLEPLSGELVVRTYGTHAIVDQDLNFDGTVCRFVDISHEEWDKIVGDRFDKYNLKNHTPSI